MFSDALKQYIGEALNNAAVNGYDEGDKTCYEVACGIVDETDILDVFDEFHNMDACQAAEYITPIVEEWRDKVVEVIFSGKLFRSHKHE
jgi:hypothetical protein